jgi:TRAP transporter TAXI family solute receptor
MRKCILIVGIFFLVALFGIAVQPALGLDKPVKLKLSAFSSRTGTYVEMSTIAKVMKTALPAGSSIEVLPYPGGIGSSKLVNKGDAELGYAFGCAAKWGSEGTGPYKKKLTNVRALFGGLDTYWVAFVVRAGLPIQTIAEIKDKKYPLKLATGKPGSLGNAASQHVLKAYGMSFDTIKSWGGTVTLTGLGAIADLMKGGRIDAAIWLTSPGHPTWSDVAVATDVRFLPYSQPIIDKMIADYGYTRKEIPKGSFKGVKNNVPVAGTSSLVVASANLSEELVYTITKVVLENKKKLAETYKPLQAFIPEKGWQNTYYPLHPGAKRAYAEKNWIK